MALTSKDRTTNFSKDEANKLALLVRDYPVITSKKTDHASNQQKDAAWRSLAEKFNSDATTYRSIKQLQQKFNNLKKNARKEISSLKSGLRQTGGGPPPPKLSETTEWLNTLMGESISGLPAVYDSDVLGDTTVDVLNTSASTFLDFTEDDKKNEENNTVKPSLDESTQLEIENTDALQNIHKEADTECEVIFDSSTPKALLRKPISKQLSNSSNKRKIFTPVEARKKIINHFDKKKEMFARKKAREEILQKYAQEEHYQNMIEKREMHCKTLAFMEEKHNLYIEQQQELHALEIEFKKSMNNLLLEKIKLEIQNIQK